MIQLRPAIPRLSQTGKKQENEQWNRVTLQMPGPLLQIHDCVRISLLLKGCQRFRRSTDAEEMVGTLGRQDQDQINQGSLSSRLDVACF